MLRIGIVGAENSHCVQIAKLCNVEKAVPARAVVVWGETDEFAKASAEAGQIPEIVKDWREMLGKVDGIMIDHRHPEPHFEVAKFFLENKVPCFVDKPFTYTLAQGKALCELARRSGVPVTSFSVIPLTDPFQEKKKAMSALGRITHVNSSGPVELDSQWGGVFFYGIHQVDGAVELLGVDVESVELKRHGKDGLAILYFKDGPVVTINCVAPGGNQNFHWSVVGEKDFLEWKHTYEGNPYLKGCTAFTTMFQTGKEPIDHRRILAPVAILEALQYSLNAGGQNVKVASF